MADNTQLNAGTGGDVARTVQKGGSGGAKTGVFLLDLGGSGAESLASGTVPVSGSVGVSGSVAVSNLPSNPALETGGNLASAASALGSPSDSAAVSDSATSGLVGLVKRLLGKLSTLLAQLPTALTGSGNLKVALVESTASQAVSAASLPLPSGAATAAKQPALGTAGAASADVLSVQGIASMTPLKVDGSAVTQPVSGTLGQSPVASGGWTPTLVNSAASTNATPLKASAGSVGAYSLGNNGNTWAYVKIYNKATAPTVGTDTPVHVIALPPGGGREKDGGGPGYYFGTGISYAITAGPANADTTAVAANQVVGTIGTA